MIKTGAFLLTLILAVLTTHAATASPTSRVHFIYLIPSDKNHKLVYEEGIRNAATSIQRYFNSELDGHTFQLDNVIVTPVFSEHDSAWFATDMWGKAINEAGAEFFDPENAYIIYLDADPACGEVTGGTSGIALMPANDLRGLAGEAYQPVCDEQPTSESLNRWIGGAGHEIGHALGLPHPPGCEEGLPECDTNALMWFGFITWPNTYLTEADKTILRNSSYITQIRQQTFNFPEIHGYPLAYSNYSSSPDFGANAATANNYCIEQGYDGAAETSIRGSFLGARSYHRYGTWQQTSSGFSNQMTQVLCWDGARMSDEGKYRRSFNLPRKRVGRYYYYMGARSSDYRTLTRTAKRWCQELGYDEIWGGPQSTFYRGTYQYYTGASWRLNRSYNRAARRITRITCDLY